MIGRFACLGVCLLVLLGAGKSRAEESIDQKVKAGLRRFFAQTARPDGSFQPGIDPQYLGMSDTAYSDLAAVTYAATLHQTFGWKLPHPEATIQFLQSRQKKNGDFFNVAGTVDPESAAGRTYNTTQGLVALHALASRPLYDPLPVFEEILREDYKTLPPYSTSFFPLAYLCAGKPIPPLADRGIRALMIQDETGYMNDHVAATFHASHYYRLVGEEAPKSSEMVNRILRDQKPDGSWMLFMPSRDRHATFDAVFTLRHEGAGREDCRQAIQKAAAWALSCQNQDGGFGHFPGSTSDADANYFHVGVLVMAGLVKPCDPLPNDPHLLSWGHLMPVGKTSPQSPRLSLQADGWVGGVAIDPASSQLAVGSADNRTRLYDLASGKLQKELHEHQDYVAAVRFHPTAPQLATASYDHTAILWDLRTGKIQHQLQGHQGAVLDCAFSPSGELLATGGIDSTIRLWDTETGELVRTLNGHGSWVSGLAFTPDNETLVSGSSDGTVKIWTVATGRLVRTLPGTAAEVRSIAVSPDGNQIAAGIRYGRVRVWDLATGKEQLSFLGHDADVFAVAFSPDGRTLATGDGDWNRGGQVKLWDPSTGDSLGFRQHTGEVLAIAFSPDGHSLAAGAADKRTKVWSLPGKK
ncbi:prenyltransferase/squalene oxidase repeat-containing protein [Lignipirellula cremea]|uniref:WD domain, G-beta repeat n=1 Tax=Lignipirellula cremea TaxID=2528010 RepID=A0A518E154_9BACT|nr:prenyltransferase/squalene oxidase repeat-containing protein [Lignipirellula cremea]QDU97803.1 WD domain, G-beta repeat [Lignipirellula cremea]